MAFRNDIVILGGNWIRALAALGCGGQGKSNLSFTLEK